MAFLGPWARINVLGGPNNSGKSAFLDATRIALGNLQDGRLGLTPGGPIATLDSPLTYEGPAPPSFEVGYCIDFGDEQELAAAFFGAVNGRFQTDPGDWANLKHLLDSEVFLGPQLGDVKSRQRWFWTKSGVPESLPEWLDKAIKDREDSSRALREVTSSGYSGTVSWAGVLSKLLSGVSAFKAVIHIPASRRVQSTAHRTFDLPSTDGSGLPGMLLSMLAPPAESYHRARKRLSTIDTFVREVTGRQTATLLVPHDAQTVHVALEDRVLPLSHLGAGIEQLVILATICTEHEDSLILIEEPDLYLHPTLQRQLLRYLMNSTTNTYLATSHSAAMLDTDFASVFAISWDSSSGTSVRLVSTPNERAALATALGFRASDLVQANSILWVEGPSDRIYLKRWINILDQELIEGIHYSFVLYGGRLAEHLTALDDPQGRVDEQLLDNFLQITRINRHSIFVMDSDLTKTGQPLSSYKTRIIDEFTSGGSGFAWVTCGTMIENYLDPSLFLDAYREVHPRKQPPYSGEMNVNPFLEGVKQPNKVNIAERAVTKMAEVPDRGKLLQKVRSVVQYIRTVNGLAES